MTPAPTGTSSWPTGGPALAGTTTGTPLPFTSPYLLAPMEGVTDPGFRDLVLDLHAPADLGGAFTEFVRVSASPMPRRVLRAHLGSRRFRQPVGLQLMGNDLEAMAETASRAIEVGAPLIDLNFGCPARGAQRTCAGSALLADPPRMERIVARIVAAAAGRVPVTAKMRSGVLHDQDLEPAARAIEAGGASLLTIHCRTRNEGYSDAAVDWRRIARAVRAVSLPVCGNGGATSLADLRRMRDETGCAFAMVGRAAIGNPWLYRERPASAAEARQFLFDYLRRVLDDTAGHQRHAASRMKQLIRYWTAGGLFADDRESWLTEPSAALLVDRALREFAAGAESRC